MGYKFNPFTGNLDLIGTTAAAGADTQVQYNNGGSLAGAPGSSVGATGDITLSLNGAASTPPLALTGTWFSGGTSTTTKPQVLIEPTGTTSTAWNTSGTGLGINAASGFSGNLLDLQVNGASKVSINQGAYTEGGKIFFGGTASAAELVANNSVGTQLTWGTTTLTLDTLGVRISSANGAAYVMIEASNIVAQRNGTNAQTYRLYNTYTDASNYERAKLAWNSNVFEIGTEGTGTGSEQPVRITATTLKLPNLPTYADNTAATSGGLVAGDAYKTATGELRITV